MVLQEHDAHLRQLALVPRSTAIHGEAVFRESAEHEMRQCGAFLTSYTQLEHRKQMENWTRVLQRFFEHQYVNDHVTLPCLRLFGLLRTDRARSAPINFTSRLLMDKGQNFLRACWWIQILTSLMTCLSLTLFATCASIADQLESHAELEGR